MWDWQFWLYEISVFLVDIIIVYLSFFLVFNLKVFLGGTSGLPFEIYNSIIVPLAMIWLIVFFMGGMYKYPRKEEPVIQQVVINSFAITSSAVITLLIAYTLSTEIYFTFNCVLFVWFVCLLFANTSRIVLRRLS
ncbi:MAG: hypothetical protein QME05_03440 [Candidatus Margulisbacteria bacterium]|nr:hypothetical protein [Candidatus Margulisiibacteriota bacterium]